MPENRVVQRIAAYRAAYEAANGKTAPAVKFARGWYYVESEFAFVPSSKFRAARIDEMTAVLAARPSPFGEQETGR